MERDLSAHIDPIVLASLSEAGGCDCADSEVLSHLSRCRTCMAIHAEFVRARAEFLRDPHGTLPPPDVLQRGLDIPLPDTHRHAAVGGGGRRRWLAPAVAGLAVAALAAVVIWPPGTPPAPPAVASELQHRLSERMCEDSYGGLVYADALMPRPTGTRGRGGDPADEDVSALLRLNAEEAPDPEVAYWLVAGLLAANQLRDADPYVRQSLARFPGDPRFHNLAAILAYKRSDLALAEKELRAALARERGPAVLLNLARVVTESGRPAEAARFLSEIVERYPSSPAAGLARERAAAVLSPGLR